MSKRLHRVLCIAIAAVLILSNMTVQSAHAEGTGTWDNPYTVTQAIAIQDDSIGTVQGYIVGQPISEKTVLTSNFTGDTALAIADTPGETDTTKMLYVQIVAAFRSEFGLKSHPENMGQQITVTGKLTPYFTPHPGLKEITRIEKVTSGGEVPVAGVELDKEQIAVSVGGTGTLKASVEPSDAANKNVIWTSDKPEVALVDNGVVRGVSQGSAVITVTTEDGGFQDTCTVQVKTELTIEEARSNELNDIVTVRGVVTYVDGINYYIQDDTAAINVYISGITASAGDMLKTTGALADYRGLLEIKPANSGAVEVLSSGNPMPQPEVVTISQISDAIESQLVKIENVILGAINTSGNTPITDSENNTINIYKIPELSGIVEGDRVDVTAIVSQYNDFQLRVRDASDVVKADEEPDTNPPVIDHTPVISGNTGLDLLISAGVSDDVKIVYVKLFYRIKGQEAYEQINMVLDGGSYSGSIPKEKLSPLGMEYYIEAFDGTNKATSPEDINNPYEVEISEEDINGPQVINMTPASGENTGDNLRPSIGAEYSDPSGIDTDSIKLYIDDDDVTTKSQITESSILYNPDSDLSKGEHFVKLEVSDRAPTPNKSIVEWNFYTGGYNLYFGQLHSHTNLSDGQGTPDDAYAWARDEAKADFFAVTDHSNSFDNDTKCSLSDGSASAEWNRLKSTADSFNEPGRFAAIAGFEMTWSGSTGGWGHMNTFNTEGFETRNNSTMDLKAYYNKLSGFKDSISQLNHPGDTFGDFADFGYYSTEADDVINLIEVGNGEGAVRSSGYFPSYEYYTRALDKGWHLAPSNNQDNHMGKWITANEARTVVLAPELTRESVYDALRNMRVYATEDRNLNISYKVNGQVMGAQLKDPEMLNIDIEFEDPDADDTIKKVSIISNGGTVAASKAFDSNSGSWNLQLEPKYSYYYVRIDEDDSDIAVTAPVWTGEVVLAGISKVQVSQDPQIVNNPVDITATVYNNYDKPISNVNVEFYKNSPAEENKIGEALIPSVGASSIGNVKITWTPGEKGEYTIYAKMKAYIDGEYMEFVESTSLKVAYEDEIVKVVIDGGHYNQYVTGDYSGKMVTLASMLKAKEYMLVQNNDELTSDDLHNAKILIITDPQSKDKSGLKRSNFTEAELQAISDFTEGGGSLILTSRADYDDIGVTDPAYESSVQGNGILEAVGSNLRFNDDEVIDNTYNGGQNYRLYFDDYTSSKYNLTGNIPEGLLYSAYSGCSVLLKDGGDETYVDWLVKGHDTTESFDSDSQNDAVAVLKGDVKSIAAEVLPEGGKIVVAGTTFFSDFETASSDNAYSNKQITLNIINWMTMPSLKTIKEVRADEDKDGVPDNLGKSYMVEGRVTAASKAASPDTSFFDCMYVQDETGGITVFGVSTKAVPLGSKVRVTGVVDQYLGDTELQISDENSDIEIVDDSIELIEPMLLSTGESMLEENEGWLVRVEGRVVRMTENTLYIDDGSGEARIYVDGYIGDGSGNPDAKGKWNPNIKLNDTVSAAGLASEDPVGHRLRVRNTSEIFKKNIDVTGVKLDKHYMELYAGSTGKLNAEVIPENATNKNIIFTSSDEAIAKVDENGTVTAEGVGIAEITVATEDGGFTDRCQVAVNAYKPVKGISIRDKNIKLGSGQTYKIIYKITPEDASNKNVKWISSDTNIAEVDSEGNVKGISKGNVRITAITEDGGKWDSCTVSVIPLTGIRLNKNSIEMNTGDSVKLKVNPVPANAPVPYVTWYVSEGDCAVVTAYGKVIAVKEGYGKIMAATADGRYSAQCTVRVKPVKKEVMVQSITLNNIGKGQYEGLLTAGKSASIGSKLIGEGGKTPTNKNLLWQSSDDSIALVDDEGMVTGLAPGKVTITASACDMSGAASSVHIEVVQPAVNINMDKLVRLKAGEEVQLMANIEPADITADNIKIEWLTNDLSGRYIELKGGTGVEYDSYGNPFVKASIKGIRAGSVLLQLRIETKDGQTIRTDSTITVVP